MLGSLISYHSYYGMSTITVNKQSIKDNGQLLFSSHQYNYIEYLWKQIPCAVQNQPTLHITSNMKYLQVVALKLKSYLHTMHIALNQSIYSKDWARTHSVDNYILFVFFSHLEILKIL